MSASGEHYLWHVTPRLVTPDLGTLGLGPQVWLPKP